MICQNLCHRTPKCLISLGNTKRKLSSGLPVDGLKLKSYVEKYSEELVEDASATGRRRWQTVRAHAAPAAAMVKSKPVDGAPGKWLTELTEMDDEMWKQWAKFHAKHDGTEDWSEAKTFMDANLQQNEGLALDISALDLRMSIRKAALFTAVSVDNWKRNELNVHSDRHLE